MTRAQELLDAATPLPWSWGQVNGYLATTRQERADSALVVYAVNNLPALWAAVEALERLVAKVPGQAGYIRQDLMPALQAADAALARLRDEVPADVL